MDTPFVGRRAELARLRAGVVGALGGSGRLILVSGPAGIGKSRLVDELRGIADEYGVPIVRGYAVDDVGMPALWPWQRLAREVPDLAAALAATSGLSATDRFTMFVAVTDALRTAAAERGLVVVLEDMHWSDRTSLLLLRHVLADLHGARLLVACTCRIETEGPWPEELPDLMRVGNTTTIELTGLSEREIRQWVAQSAPAPATLSATRLRAQTAGNPLLIRLLLESAAEIGNADGTLDPTLPPQLHRLVLAQVGKASAPARAALGAASVLGEALDLPALAAMLDTSEASVVDVLTEVAGVTTIAAGRLAFAHALIRDAVYADLGAGQRMVWHRRAAEALCAQPGADAVAGSIAAHWQRAGGAGAAQQCAHWARCAAETAMRTHAYDEAIRFLELALDAGGATSPPREHGAVLLELARAEFAGGRVAASLEHCTAAAQAGERAGDPQLIAAAALVIHGIGSTEVMQAIDRMCTAALRLLPSTETALIARLEAQRVLAALELDDFEFARGLSVHALQLAERSGDPDAVLDGLHARHVALSAPQYVTERTEIADRAIELGWSASQPMAALWGLLWRTEVAFQHGDLTAVDRLLGQVEELAAVRKWPIAQWHSLRIKAALAAMHGDLREAEEYNHAALMIGERAGDTSMSGLFHAFRAQLNLLRGVVDDPEGDVAMLGGFARIALARVFIPITQALAGDLDSARESFAEFRSMPDSTPVGPRWAPLLVHIGIVAVLLDDAVVADRVFRRMRGLDRYYSGDGSGPFFCMGAMARPIADFALAAGHVSEAVELYRRAIEANERIGARPYIALSKLGLAQALSTGDEVDLTDARTLCASAAAEFRRLELPGPLRDADRSSARIDAAVRARNPLSAREREVAGLIVENLSNREIAARLVLSERTVETHVRSILAKLGVTNRSEIAAWAQRARTYRAGPTRRTEDPSRPAE